MKKLKLVFISLLVVFTLVMTRYIINDNNGKFAVPVNTIYAEEGGGGVIYPPPQTSPELTVSLKFSKPLM